MTPASEFERRIRRASQLREAVLTLRRAAREAHARGEIPFAPLDDDIRSDPEHWRRLLAQQERKEP